MRPLLLFVSLTTGVPAAFAAEPPKTPNVLFIVSDDLNCDLGCYGHKVVRSPNIDRLAASGVRFDRAYVQYTVCNPSRTSFLTGLRPTTTRVMDNATHFRKTLPNAVSLPELFRHNGYETIGLGKVFHRGLSPDDTKTERDDPKSFDRVFYGKTTAEGNKGGGRNLTGGALAWCRWLAAKGADSEQADGQLADEAVKILGEKRDKPTAVAVDPPAMPNVIPILADDQCVTSGKSPPRTSTRSRTTACGPAGSTTAPPAAPVGPVC